MVHPGLPSFLRNPGLRSETWGTRAVNWLFVGTSNEFGEFESGVTAQWWGAVRAVVIGGIGSLVVTASAAVLFPQLRRADALTAESLQSAERELATAEPID